MSAKLNLHNLAITGGVLVALGHFAWIVIFLRHAPGDTILQQSRVLWEPPITSLSIYLLAVGIFGLAYTIRLFSPGSPSAFWRYSSYFVVAWLAAQMIFAGRTVLVFQLPALAIVMYCNWQTASRPAA